MLSSTSAVAFGEIAGAKCYVFPYKMRHQTSTLKLCKATGAGRSRAKLGPCSDLTLGTVDWEGAKGQEQEQEGRRKQRQKQKDASFL